ncbi:hypothetical protein GCM10010377_50120 [Streptomyces viridiviolaceus]|uniref:Hyaluronoglucosaminidase n=1 Tax=Streptomyces viridiviolaceus TaxID=68282 RepID=A0ABW2E735_9ACTN|nr:hyaluronoglucosaminidase [Streptomyces viridiviolaceus]GHB53096.1 hypothetical protein GCM10010377_50120 [Streptomyces viridiviolaceus]
MAVGRRVFLGAFTAGAVTVAAGTEAAAEGEYTDYAAPANFWSTSTTAYTVTINCAATSGTASALNVTSRNPATSAMNLSGTETARGTLKISHVGYADGSDADASGLSIDLKTQGTAAQGIFVTATQGPTTGSLIVLRNNPGVDDFVVKGSGRTGIGVGRGDKPLAQLHVVQRSDAPAALLLEGAARLADVDTEPTNAPADRGGGSLYAQNGALYWKGSSGVPTRLAPA